MSNATMPKLSSGWSQFVLSEASDSGLLNFGGFGVSLGITSSSSWMHGMSTSAEQFNRPTATAVEVSEDTLAVELQDGRTLIVPLSWYPRLEHATKGEREQWRLIGGGAGIHWDAIDEDVSVEALLAGRPSSESQSSLKRWLQARGA
jgi:hypothetical protein